MITKQCRLRAVAPDMHQLAQKKITSLLIIRLPTSNHTIKDMVDRSTEAHAIVGTAVAVIHIFILEILIAVPG